MRTRDTGNIVASILIYDFLRPAEVIVAHAGHLVGTPHTRHLPFQLSFADHCERCQESSCRTHSYANNETERQKIAADRSYRVAFSERETILRVYVLDDPRRRPSLGVFTPRERRCGVPPK